MRSRFVTGCSYCSARSPAWRFAEFAALRRRDIDLKGGELRVHRSQAELKRGRTIIKDPKSEPVDALSPSRPWRSPTYRTISTGSLSLDPTAWCSSARKAAPCGDETSMRRRTGASTKELMTWMGHSTLADHVFDLVRSLPATLWRRRDSNPQPLPCKGSALPVELRPRLQARQARPAAVRSSGWWPRARDRPQP